ncbi:MAG: YbaB/EbfC family nucleoid-associated protein [Planctomycetaceae bacterium]
MLKGLGNLANLMKSAQQLQERMASMNDSLADVRVQGIAGGGMVSVEATAQQRIVRCRIEESLIATGDREMIEDLLVAAANQALEKAKQAQAEAMSRMAGDLHLPGLGDALNRLGLGGDANDAD